MRKTRANPFESDSAPKPSVENESVPTAILPERGTGLKNGNAGERRGGIPRTEKEREERHENKFNVVVVDGVKMNRLGGYEPEPEPLSLKDQWAQHRENKKKK